MLDTDLRVLVQQWRLAVVMGCIRYLILSNRSMKVATDTRSVLNSISSAFRTDVLHVTECGKTDTLCKQSSPQNLGVDLPDWRTFRLPL